MLTVNCTKKLRDELSTSTKVKPGEDRDDFYNWHADLIYVNHRKCVLLMNVETRYSIFLYGLKKQDFAELGQLCRKYIKINFNSAGINKSQIDEYMSNTDEIKFTKTYSRSILASINSLKRNIGYRIRHLLPTGRKNLTRLNKKHNRIPILTMEPAYPIDALKEAFKERMPHLQQPQDIYQFRISLKDITPEIWRRLMVPRNYTFWGLHMAIQKAMGWENRHLHEFKVKNSVEGKEVAISFPDEEYDRGSLIS